MPKKVTELFPRLGELVVRKKLASAKQVDEALAQQQVAMERKRPSPKLGEILIRRGILDRADIREILEEQRIGRGEKRVLKIGLDIPRDGVAFVSLRGRLDQHKCDALARILDRLMDRGLVRIVLDCKHLVAMDGYGAAALVPYIDEARLRGGDIKLAFSAYIRPYLEQSGIAHFLDIIDSTGQAEGAFRKSMDDLLSKGTLGEYVSSAPQRNYHLSFCSDAQKIALKDKVFYQNKRHARLSGKISCDKCLP